MRPKMPNNLLLLRVALFVTCACSGFLGTSAQGPVLTMISDEVCYGSRVVLLCIHPDPIADPDKYLLPQVLAWAENGTTIDFTDPASARFTPIRLNSTASTLSFDITEEDHRDRGILYTCFLVRNNANRDREESNPLVLDPQEHPTPPTLSEPITTTPSTVTLKVDHRNTCFENCTFQYEVKVQPVGSMFISTTTHSTNVFNVSGLSGGTRYRAEIVAVCVEESTIRSAPLNVNFTTRMEDGTTVTPTTPPDNDTDPTATSTPDTVTLTLSTGLIAGIVVVCVVVILLTLLAGCGGGVMAYVVYQKNSKQSTGSSEETFDEDKKNSTIPSYVNVELDDKSVPMTTNPSYGQVERKQDCPKLVYANL